MTELVIVQIGALLAAFLCLSAVGAVVTLLPPRARSALGGALIAALVVSTVVSYAYSALSSGVSADYPAEQCLGAPYETC